MSKLKEPYNLSPRIQGLRDYYFKGETRNWNNESKSFTTGTSFDTIYDELTFYIVPEVHTFFNAFDKSYVLGARKLDLPEDFFKRSLPERKEFCIRQAIVEKMPAEILPGDLLCGARFNISVSRCFNKREAKAYEKIVRGKDGLRERLFEFKDRGFGNCGSTSGHLIPDYPYILRNGFKAKRQHIEELYHTLTSEEKEGRKGDNLRAMLIACDMPRKLQAKYNAECLRLATNEKDEERKKELIRMAEIIGKVPELSAEDFYEAIQALWFTHMLVMTDENYPGPGVSFGRLDQYLFPYYLESMKKGVDREFIKEILKCFFIHANTAYDFMIRVGGNQGITAGYGQLFNLSGMGKGGKDMTNELTYLMLEVIDEMSPILEPKPNVRLHKNSPEQLLDKVVDMISVSQGAPFLLNFDERSMAGLLRQAEKAGVKHLINEDNVFDYASVGCLENTMCGNDRSQTVDCNPNLYKAVELALGNGQDLIVYKDALWGKPYKVKEHAPATGDPRNFVNFEEFYQAFEKQISYVIKRLVALYNDCDTVRAEYTPTPYLSTLVRGCAEQGLDITQGGPELKFVTIEGVTFATTVDSLLAIKYLVFDKKLCTMDELITALKNNWVGYEKLQTTAINRAPKYGRDDDEADELARRVMEYWAEECWKYKTKTDKQYRGGMLSWNYWIGSGYILPASPDGRKHGQFLSNAICPVNGTDTNGPTANANSVGKVLGGFAEQGDFMHYVNYLPNGASHTITLNPSVTRDDDHKAKLKAFLKGYIENGGTALQINILDAEMLRDAQKHPENYKNLLVRVTGYNAYFTSIGKELQDEVIARESHKVV
ncbi:MAG: pyruvate formate lyase family protein [Clostridia bacterium]